MSTKALLFCWFRLFVEVAFVEALILSLTMKPIVLNPTLFVVRTVVFVDTLKGPVLLVKLVPVTLLEVMRMIFVPSGVRIEALCWERVPLKLKFKFAALKATPVGSWRNPLARTLIMTVGIAGFPNVRMVPLTSAINVPAVNGAVSERLSLIHI